MSETTISLVKGQKVDLTKGNVSLKVLGLGLGWDVKAGADADLDAFAIALDANNKPVGSLIYFNNLTGQGITHSGDNLTGAGDGDDEVITIDFAQVPAEVVAIVLGANIFKAAEKGQNFGQIQNAFIRAFNKDTNEELLKYDLSEDFSINDAVIFGKVYSKDGEWKFSAEGVGKNGDLIAIFESYK